MSSDKQLAILSPKAGRAIPYARYWNILFRTLHLIAISLLVGGHAFGASTDHLRLLLYGAIVTGAGMLVVDAYPSFEFLHQLWGVFVLFKLAMLCVIPFAWNYRVPILIAVIVIGSVGSHVPKKFRHYSLIYGPEQKK